MNRPFIDPNLSDGDKIKKLIKISERLARRSQKVTKAIVTPFPISNSVVGEDVKGEILRYMFCGRGIIKKGRLWLNKRPESGAVIVLTLENEIGSNAKSYTITRKDMSLEPNLEVFSGDRLTVSIHAINPEKDKIEEVWIAFKWVPRVEDTEIKRVLIDELDKIGLDEE